MSWPKEKHWQWWAHEVVTELFYVEMLQETEYFYLLNVCKVTTLKAKVHVMSE